MCYYSTTLHPSKFRDAVEGEDLTLQRITSGHHGAVGDSDGKIVCVKHSDEVHFEKLEMNPEVARTLLVSIPRLSKYIGQPVSARFANAWASSYSADKIILSDGTRFHFFHLKLGTKFYTGKKRVKLETRLGVDDPSISLDHGPQRDDAPTHQTMLAKIDGLCSITR